MRFIESLTGRLESAFTWIAGAAVITMMMVTVVNMVLRKLGMPFGAVAEVVGWCAALSIAFALGYSQARRAHISIELVVDRFPARVQGAVGTLTLMLSVGMFGLATHQVFVYGQQLVESGQLSESLRIPFYPIVWAVGIGMIAFVLRLLIDVAKEMGRVVRP